MIAEFSVYATDSTQIGRHVVRVADVLEASRLPYWIGPVGASVEGDWDGVMAVIRQCQQAVGEGHDRVITTIVIDDRPAQPSRLAEMVRTVEEQIGRRVPRADMDAVC